MYCRTAPHADWANTFIATANLPVKKKTVTRLVNIRDVLRWIPQKIKTRSKTNENNAITIGLILILLHQRIFSR